MTLGKRRRRTESVSQLHEQRTRGGVFIRVTSSEYAPYHGLSGVRLQPVDGAPPRREGETHASAVARIRCARDQASSRETGEYTRQRAWMQDERGSQVASRDAWKLPDDADHQPLRAGDPESLPHPLRDALKPMIDRPEQAHELEHSAQGARGGRPTHVGRILLPGYHSSAVDGATIATPLALGMPTVIGPPAGVSSPKRL